MRIEAEIEQQYSPIFKEAIGKYLEEYFYQLKTKELLSKMEYELNNNLEKILDKSQKYLRIKKLSSLLGHRFKINATFKVTDDEESNTITLSLNLIESGNMKNNAFK